MIRLHDSLLNTIKTSETSNGFQLPELEMGTGFSGTCIVEAGGSQLKESQDGSVARCSQEDVRSGGSRSNDEEPALR